MRWRLLRHKPCLYCSSLHTSALNSLMVLRNFVVLTYTILLELKWIKSIISCIFLWVYHCRFAYYAIFKFPVLLKTGNIISSLVYHESSNYWSSQCFGSSFDLSVCSYTSYFRKKKNKHIKSISSESTHSKDMKRIMLTRPWYMHI